MKVEIEYNDLQALIKQMSAPKDMTPMEFELLIRVCTAIEVARAGSDELVMIPAIEVDTYGYPMLGEHKAVFVTNPVEVSANPMLNKVSAIKLLRAHTGYVLKDAMESFNKSQMFTVPNAAKFVSEWKLLEGVGPGVFKVCKVP